MLDYISHLLNTKKLGWKKRFWHHIFCKLYWSEWHTLLISKQIFKSWTIKLRSGPHSKLKADENAAYLPGYSMKNGRKRSFHRNPFKSRGFPHASQNGICRPEMRNFHIMVISYVFRKTLISQQFIWVMDYFPVRRKWDLRTRMRRGPIFHDRIVSIVKTQ